jgi:hypothetical protein
MILVDPKMFSFVVKGVSHILRGSNIESYGKVEISYINVDNFKEKEKEKNNNTCNTCINNNKKRSKNNKSPKRCMGDLINTIYFSKLLINI